VLDRIGRAYRYRVTNQGTKVALMFIRSTGASANHSPTRKADHTIQQVLHLLAAGVF